MSGEEGTPLRSLSAATHCPAQLSRTTLSRSMVKAKTLMTADVVQAAFHHGIVWFGKCSTPIENAVHEMEDVCATFVVGSGVFKVA